MDYTYTRVMVDGTYSIANPLRLDGSGDQIHLSKEVESALPGKAFKLICNGAEAKFVFTEALSGAEKTTLDAAVTDHQENN